MSAGFLPAGYRRLADAREEVGAERLGQSLAAGQIKAVLVDPRGKLHPAKQEVWRTRLGREILALGHVPKAKHRLDSGWPVLVPSDPATGAPSAGTIKRPTGGSRKRGAKPAVLPRVIDAMRPWDPAALNQMTEEAMAAEFNASRDTCRKARQAILDNSQQIATTDK